MRLLNCKCFWPLKLSRKQFYFYVCATHLIFMLFETNLVFMLFALMLFGNPPIINPHVWNVVFSKATAPDFNHVCLISVLQNGQWQLLRQLPPRNRVHHSRGSNPLWPAPCPIPQLAATEFSEQDLRAQETEVHSQLWQCGGGPGYRGPVALFTRHPRHPKWQLLQLRTHTRPKGRTK